MKMGTLGNMVLAMVLTMVLTPLARPQAPAADSSPAATSGSPSASSNSLVVGDWKSVVTRDGNPVHVILHIAADKSGTLLATIDAIEMQASGVVVSNVVLKDAKLTFDVDEAPGSYAGTLNKDATEIDGTWTQDGNDYAMNFTKDVSPAPATGAPAAPAESAPAAPAQQTAPATQPQE